MKQLPFVSSRVHTIDLKSTPPPPPFIRACRCRAQVSWAKIWIVLQFLRNYHTSFAWRLTDRSRQWLRGSSSDHSSPTDVAGPSSAANSKQGVCPLQPTVMRCLSSAGDSDEVACHLQMTVMNVSVLCR